LGTAGGEAVKTVFLILYFWHADQYRSGINNGGGIGLNGGPVLRIEQMPSVSACEVIGKAVKDLVDQQRQGPPSRWQDYQPERNGAHSGLPAVYNCVEVSK
jgi:hypothetical protein